MHENLKTESFLSFSISVEDTLRKMDLFHEGNIHFIDEDYDLAVKV